MENGRKVFWKRGRVVGVADGDSSADRCAQASWSHCDMRCRIRRLHCGLLTCRCPREACRTAWVNSPGRSLGKLARQTARKARQSDCLDGLPRGHCGLAGLIWQKTPLGGLAAAFSSLAGRKRDYGASRDASESQEKLEKERRSAKSGRKSANRAPNATLNPCSEAPWRRFLPSCEQNRATAAFHKEKPAKRYEHLAGFDPNRPRTASSLPTAALRHE